MMNIVLLMPLIWVFQITETYTRKRWETLPEQDSVMVCDLNMFDSWKIYPRHYDALFFGWNNLSNSPWTTRDVTYLNSDYADSYHREGSIGLSRQLGADKILEEYLRQKR